MTQKGKQKHWSYMAGEKGRNRVRAFEVKGGRLHLEFMEHGRRKSISLGHSNHTDAKEEADRVAAGLGHALKAREQGQLSLGELFDIYLREVTPGKGLPQQVNDRRIVRLWLEVIHPSRLASSLTARDAEAYIAHRRARGDLRPGRGGAHRSQPIRPRSWRADLALLKAVLRWGRSRGLIEADPGILHFRDRTKAEVRRPILTDKELPALMEAARHVGSACYCLFVLAHETGHRVTAIRELRWSDVNLIEGSVHWRPELDKIGYDHTTPLSATAIAVLKARQEELGLIGDLPVFPAPKAPLKPVSKDLVRDWWQRMEAIAGLPHEDRRGWHSLRRKFASDLKHRPLVDVAALGGWKDTTTITRSYQKADPDTMRSILATRRGPLGSATAEGTAELDRRHRKNHQPRLA